MPAESTRRSVFALVVCMLVVCEPYAVLASSIQSGKIRGLAHKLRRNTIPTDAPVVSMEETIAAAHEPEMAEPNLLETTGETSTHAMEDMPVAMVLAELAGEGEIPTVPKSELPPNFNMKPVMTKRRNFWRPKHGLTTATLVGRAQLQDMIAYDAEAAQMSAKRINGLKRIRSGETAGPKLLKAHYHTSKLVSPTQSKITADVRGSDGLYVEPEVIGHVVTGTDPAVPVYQAPTYLAPKPGKLSKPADNKDRSGPKVHIIGAPTRAQRKAARAARRIAKAVNGVMAKPVPASSVVAPRPLAQRRPRRVIQRKASDALVARAARRAALRRLRARQAAALIRRAKAAIATPQPRFIERSQEVVTADKEAQQLSEAARTIQSVKSDTASLLSGQKALLETTTAARSNSDAERAVALDEKILAHVSKLEDALSAVLDENRAMHAMQRANLASLVALHAQVNVMGKHQSALESAQHATASVKAFPHLRAVSAVVTEDNRFMEVSPSHDAEATTEFHASITPEHATEQALDSALDAAEQNTASAEEHRFAAEAEVEAETAAETQAAAATTKTDEEIAMEKLMTSLVEAAEESEDEAEDEEEADSEEEEEDAEEEEADAEEETEEEAEEEEEEEEAPAALEAEAEAAAESESEAAAADAEEEETDLVEINAESTEESDILRLAERNAALVKDHASRMLADEAAETDAAAPLPEVSSIPTSLSELSAADASSADEELSDKAEAEAASLLGLPDVPGTVPNAVHDDLSEVAAEVEMELAAHRNGRKVRSGEEIAHAAIQAASAARFREEMPAEAAESHADVAAAQDAADEAEFNAVMHGEDSQDAAVNAAVEHELSNEDAADVDIASESASADLDVAAIDSEMEAATADSADDSIENNKDVQDMKAVIAQLQAEIAKTKAEGARM